MLVLTATTGCGEPDIDPSTTVLSTGTTNGSLAIYTCIQAGHSITSGSMQRVCGDNGQWTLTAPICSPDGRYFTVSLYVNI